MKQEGQDKGKAKSTVVNFSRFACRNGGKECKGMFAAAKIKFKIFFSRLSTKLLLQSTIPTAIDIRRFQIYQLKGSFMKIKSLFALSAFTFAASSAMAGDWYAVGSIGQAKVKDFNQSELDAELRGLGVTGLTSSLDDSDTAFKLHAGYQFNRNFALEGGYLNLGKANYSARFTGGTASAELKTDGWSLSAVGILPLNEQFSLFGKLGAAYNTVKVNIAATGPGGNAAVSDKDSDVGAVYGLGASYNLTKQIALRAEYEVYDKIGGNETGKSKVDVWSLGIAYKF
jgi:OOP family OmpA-OmpF porin